MCHILHDVSIGVLEREFSWGCRSIRITSNDLDKEDGSGSVAEITASECLRNNLENLGNHSRQAEAPMKNDELRTKERFACSTTRVTTSCISCEIHFPD